MKYVFAMAALSVLTAVESCAQYDAPHNMRSRSIPTGWTTIALEEVGENLQLVLPDPVNQRWVLGVEVKPDGKDRVDISEARLKTLAITRIRTLEQVSAYDRSKVRTSRGAVSVEGSGNDSVLVVSVEMVRPRVVDISGGGSTPTRLRVENSVLLVDGSPTGKGFSGRHELILIAGFGSGSTSASATSVPTRTQQGTYVVAADLLRSHLIRYVGFGPVAEHAGPRTLIVHIEIGPDGAVKDVRCQGDESGDLSSMIAATLRQWTFRPFQVNGRVESVQARFPVLVTPEGRVASEFSPTAVVR